MVMRLVARLKRMQTLGVMVAFPFLLLVAAGFAILSAAGNGRPGASGPPARQTSTAQSTASTRPEPATTTLASACEAGNGGAPSVAPVDGMQLPLPPGTTVGPSLWGYQPNGSYNSPFIRTPLCTEGMSQASLLAYMRKQMPIYSWTATSTDGTAWKIPTGGAVIILHIILPLSAAGDWAITEGYLDDGPPPIFPTPEPPGADASCAQVPRLEHAAPLNPPGFSFPADTVGVVSARTNGIAYTVVDYFGCAPHHELTANPAFGSGGYPIGAIFPPNWQLAGVFPFDGTTLQGCDSAMSGNYLIQHCVKTPNGMYMAVQQIAEPGKGLMSFHLLLATPKG
jgi:hypothetical protein